MVSVRRRRTPPGRSRTTAARSAPDLPPDPDPALDTGTDTGHRDPFLDNAKYLTILLVVCGHAWEPLREQSRTAQALYLTVYAFHMPAFIIISGHLSRGFEAHGEQLRRLLTRVAVPYLVFETLFTVFMRLTAEPGRPFSLIDPGYALWFLVALFIWRLTAPVWRLLRQPLPVALVIAALATTAPDLGGSLDLQRVLQFLPFFVLGMRLRPEHFAVLRRRGTRVLAVPVTLAAFAAAYWAAEWLDVSWLYHNRAAPDLGLPWWTGVAATPVLFGCALLLTGCLFAWVPARRVWYTALGAGTLYAYLLHGYLLHSARYLGWYDASAVHTAEGWLLITAVAVLAGTVLCIALVRRLLRPLVEPSLDWAFRPQDAAGPQVGEAGPARRPAGTALSG